MSFTVIDAPQRSPEWFAARAGRLTSSVADVLFARGKKEGVESVQRRDLRIRLALERLTGQSCDDYGCVTADMQRGIEDEDAARRAYESVTGSLVQSSGFIALNAHQAGTSLDGHVGMFDGVVEIKCPKPAIHLSYLRTREIPPAYVPQIRHHLWVTGAQWADWVSFNRQMPAGLQMVIYRASRADLNMGGYEEAALAFLAEVAREVSELEAMARARA